MTTVTQPVRRFALRHHQPATTAILVFLFWAIAAAATATAHRQLDPRSTFASAAVTIPILLLTAWAYMHGVARQSGVAHALAVGIAWLALSIVSEMFATAFLQHGWFSLLGTPDQPLLRNVSLFVWIFAPALFARRTAGD